MSDTVIVGLFSLIGTLVGTLGGIIASSSLTNYRLKQLESKVDKHNNFAARIPTLEQRMDTVEGEVKELRQFHMHG